MATKPITPQPLPMPNLSPLPDPVADLMGSGMTNPASLMSMTKQDYNDLFNPKPLDGNFIKPSAEATKVLQDVDSQVRNLTQSAERIRQEQLRAERERQQAIDQQVKENLRVAAELQKEREKQLKEKAEQQGGKIGAGADGSFILASKINEILGKSEWNAIKSDKQRHDEAEVYLSDFANQLRQMGVSDELITAEIENGRGMFKAHTDAYTRSMREDGQGLLDLTVAPAAKTGAFIFNTAGVLAKLVSADTVGDYLLERGKVATDAADDFVSTSVKLDQANSAYDEAKFDAQNPNANWRDGGVVGVAHGAAAAVKRAWDNDTLDNFIAEQIPQLIMTMGAGKVGASAVNVAGRALGYTTLQGASVPVALQVLGGTYKAKTGLAQLGVNALSGASLGMGAYGIAATVGDAGAGAWEQVQSASVDTIKKTYGEKKWADAVALHGGEEQARDALASDALAHAAGKVAPVAAVTSFLGLESSFAGLLTRQAIKNEARKITAGGIAKGTATTALSATEEGFEEGYTQYASNVGATDYTGVDLMQGVSTAAGLGAFLGGAATAVSNTISGLQKEQSELPVEFAGEFVKQGYFNDGAFRRNFERMMDHYAKDHRAGNITLNEAQHYQQTFYNEYIDRTYETTRADGTTEQKSIYDLMTDAQRSAFDTWIKTDYGINTNPYARHQDTVEYDAIKNSNMDELAKPENADLLNVWRVLNNTQTDQIPTDRQTYFKALADMVRHLQPTETTNNTHEQEQKLQAFAQGDLASRDLTAVDVTSAIEFGRSILGANSRRMTDDELTAWRAFQAQNQTQEQPQEQADGTDEQVQTNTSEPSGQTTLDENAEPVASQSSRIGTSQATTLQATATELADAFTRRTPSTDTQSVGNDNTRQGADRRSQTITPTTDGAGASPTAQRDGQTPTTSNTVATTTPDVYRGTPTHSGVVGQTDQSEQPTRPSSTVSTQATTGNRSLRTPQTERYSDGRSNQTLTEASIREYLLKHGADPSVLTLELAEELLSLRSAKNLSIIKQGSLKSFMQNTPAFTTAVENDVGGITPAHAVVYLGTKSNEVFNADVVKDVIGFKHRQKINNINTRRAEVMSALARHEWLAHSSANQQFHQEQAEAERAERAAQRAIEQAEQQANAQRVQEATEARKRELQAQRQAEKEQAAYDTALANARNAVIKAQAKLDQASETLSTISQKIADTQTKRDNAEQALNELLGVKGSRGKNGNIGRAGEIRKQLRTAETNLTKTNKNIAVIKEQLKSLQKGTQARNDKEKELATEDTAKQTLTDQIKDLTAQVKGADKEVATNKKIITDARVQINKDTPARNKAQRAVASAQTALDKAQLALSELEAHPPAQAQAEQVQTEQVADDTPTQAEQPTARVEQPTVQAEQADTDITNPDNSQEQPNETNNLANSQQSTTDRTQDGNEVIRERTDNEPTNVQQGEIPRQSGQPVSEQSQESGTETTQDTNELGEVLDTSDAGEQAISQWLEANPSDAQTISDFVQQERVRIEQELGNLQAQNAPQEQIDRLQSYLTDMPTTPQAFIAQELADQAFTSEWAVSQAERIRQRLEASRTAREQDGVGREPTITKKFTARQQSRYGAWTNLDPVLTPVEKLAISDEFDGMDEFLTEFETTQGNPNITTTDPQRRSLLERVIARINDILTRLGVGIQEFMSDVSYLARVGYRANTTDAERSAYAQAEQYNMLAPITPLSSLAIMSHYKKVVHEQVNNPELVERMFDALEQMDVSYISDHDLSVFAHTLKLLNVVNPNVAVEVDMVDIVDDIVSGENKRYDTAYIYGQNKVLMTYGWGNTVGIFNHELAHAYIAPRLDYAPYTQDMRVLEKTVSRLQGVTDAEVRAFFANEPSFIQDDYVGRIDYIRRNGIHELVAVYMEDGKLANFIDQNTPSHATFAHALAELVGLSPRSQSGSVILDAISGIVNHQTTHTLNNERLLDTYLGNYEGRYFSSETGGPQNAPTFHHSQMSAGVKSALGRGLDAVRNNLPAVSMALAVSAGTLFTPNIANAATPTETAVVQNIISQRDNDGKRFIIADKQAGTMTVYTSTGVPLVSTPALFGKTVGDGVTAQNTPSGRFNLNNARTNAQGYGGSVQVLSQNGQNVQLNNTPYAIHRVYTGIQSENRQGRLDSATATDNRISHGCINVPVDFYDRHLNGERDMVVYVMPETDAGRTGVFNTTPTSNIGQTTATQVAPEMDNANAQSVAVSAEQIRNATPHSELTTSPRPALAPITVANTTPSTQTAYVAPTVINGVSADRIVIPEVNGKALHTPAEQRADSTFDTEPVTATTDDGVSLAEIAVGLAGAFSAGAMISSRLRQRRDKKKLESKKKRTPVADTPTTSSEPTVEQVQETLDTEHNEQVNKQAKNAKTIPTNLTAPPQPTPVAQAVNREMWLKYLVDTNQLGYTGSSEMADMITNTLRGFEFTILADMTDRTYEQANDGTFDGNRLWGNGEVDTDRTGIRQKTYNLFAGATPVFDNLMSKLGIARIGHEADSSIASKALAQIKAKSQGAYAQIHKFFVNPMIERNKLLAQELRRSDDEVELATGRVATAKHVLNEAADAMWRGLEIKIAKLQTKLDAINADLARNPRADYPLRTLKKAEIASDEIRKLTDRLNKTRDMYEGRIAWDGRTRLPGGMTKARAEQDLREVQAEYGADYAKIEANATALVQTIRSIRQFATAAGVFTNEDLAVFDELGFTEYVPLYAEEKDPTDLNEEDNYTHTSIMDRLLQGLPSSQARSLGLTQDLSRYSRKGATSPAADAFTNMKRLAVNMAGRIGQQNWVEVTQQLYEGTVGKPYSAVHITDPDTLAELNESYDSGKVPGLIRVRPGMRDFLPQSVKDQIRDVRPTVAKGQNAQGDTVVYEYYWTEPAIQAEIYSNTDLSNTLTNEFLRDVGAATRLVARAVTVGKPVWNIYNYVRDNFERLSIMLMRPVKGADGKIVSKWKLAREFFRAIAVVAANTKDIYRYLAMGEVKTPLQTMLNEAVGEGSINLMTTQTEKQTVLSELKKSHLTKLMDKAGKYLSDGANKTGLGGVRNNWSRGVDFYVLAMTELPQVASALSSYMALRNSGVNRAETANRVRDQYDPNRTNNAFVNNIIGQFHPFVRSTLSGHYNLMRSVSEYWKPGEWQWTLAYVLGGVLGTIGILSMVAGAFDDDEDGRPALARLPLSTLMGGIPVPFGENGVWTLPVGFGLNKLLWGVGVNTYRYLNGWQSASDTALGLTGLVVDNTSPIQVASGSSLNENPMAAAILTAAPLLAKPLAELATNTKAFGGGKIIQQETPRDQLDSEQDNFNTPDTYKKWARWLNDNGFVDARPETIRHIFESYTNLLGPLNAIPQAVIADQSEKTLGNRQLKGEVFGPVLTALGAGMSIQPNALELANLTYEMDKKRYALHRKYGVGERHSQEMYERYGTRGKRGGLDKDAKQVTEARLREKGVPESHIKYILNSMEYQAQRKELNKNFRELSIEYNRLVASGKDDVQLRQQVQSAWDELELLTHNYVKENNDVYFTLP